VHLPAHDVLHWYPNVTSQTYGRQLRSKGMISQSATIRTITAGSDVANAVSAWNGPGNLPGK